MESKGNFFFDYELFDVMNIDSSQATYKQWRYLAEKIDQLYWQASDKFDFIIVTHGTDTMALCSSFLSFSLVGYPKPIIITGSQIPARKEKTDAGDQLRRATKSGEIACNPNRRICEVLVSCGNKTTRGTWAAKLGDNTSNAFGPWNNIEEAWDESDVVQAVQNGTLHKMFPHHLRFGDKLESKLKMPGHAITYEKKLSYNPFFEISYPSDIFPVTLTNKSAISFAKHLINQRVRVAVLTQLGSATADDVLVNLAIKAAENNKAIIFEAPFADSTVQAGEYVSGSGVLKNLKNLQGKVPIINTSPSAFQMKINFALHQLGIEPQGNQEGLGEYFQSEDLRRFYDYMSTNIVGELV